MVSVRYQTHDVITTVGSVWDSQHGNQSGTAKSDVRIDSTVREEMAAQARQVRPPLLSHTILTRETARGYIRIVLRRFQRTIPAFSEPSQKKHLI